MTLQEAYDHWVSLAPFHSKEPAQNRTVKKCGQYYGTFYVAPHWNGLCCGGNHFTSKMVRGFNTLVPMKYQDVCMREQAWRTYVCIRDSGQVMQ